MAELVSKNASDIAKILWGDRSKWSSYKDPDTGEVGKVVNQQVAGLTLTIVWKDPNKPNQTHSMNQNGTVTFSGGFVHISTP